MSSFAPFFARWGQLFIERFSQTRENAGNRKDGGIFWIMRDHEDRKKRKFVILREERPKESRSFTLFRMTTNSFWMTANLPES
jgi:hypothetical protein